MVCYDMYCKTSPDPPYLCSILAYSSTALFVTLIAGHIVEVNNNYYWPGKTRDCFALR